MATTGWQPIFNRLNTLSEMLEEFGGRTGFPTNGGRRQCLTPVNL